MEPRSKPPRSPRPFAIGEDAGAAPPPHLPAAANDRRARHPRAAGKAPAPQVYTTGAVTRAPGAATRERWRPVTTQRTARRTARRRRISPKRAFTVGAPLVALLALIIWLLTGSYWQTRHLRIEGTSDATLLALAHAQQLTGCDAFRCDFSAARRAIAASPRAQQVVIQVVFPDTTLVRITPRQTAALWRAQGQTWAVGADGVVIGAAQRDPSLALPNAATVDDPGDLAFAGQTPQPGAHMDATLVAMARQLRISGPGVGLDPTSLRYSAGDGFTMLANTGAQVIFGSPADARATLVDLKGESSAASALTQQEPQLTPGQTAQGAQLQVEVAGAILAQLARSGASATLIDVRWGSHPYYR